MATQIRTATGRGATDDPVNPFPFYGASAGSSGIGAPLSTAAGVTDQSIKLGQKQYAQLPGYKNSLANIGRTIESETAGELPADVIRQIQQQGAERGIATGTAGSASGNAAYLRALGLSSLDLTNLGQANFGKALPLLPGLSQNASFYTTPGLNLQANIADANLTNQQSEFKAAQESNAQALREAKAGINAGLSSGGGLGGATHVGAASWGPTSAAGQNNPFDQGSVFGNSLGNGTYIGGQLYAPGQVPGGGSPVAGILDKYSSTAMGTGGGTGSGYYYAGANQGPVSNNEIDDLYAQLFGGDDGGGSDYYSDDYDDYGGE